MAFCGFAGFIESILCYAFPDKYFLNYVERTKRKEKFDYDTEFEFFKQFRFYLLLASLFLMVTAAAGIVYYASSL